MCYYWRRSLRGSGLAFKPVKERKMINHCQLCAVFWEIALVLVSRSPLFFFPSLFFLKRRTFWLVLPCICTVCVCLSIFGWTDERLCMYVWAKSEQPCCALNTVSSQDISFLQCQHIQRHWFPQSREQHNIIAVGHLSRMFRITKTKR